MYFINTFCMMSTIFLLFFVFWFGIGNYKNIFIVFFHQIFFSCKLFQITLVAKQVSFLSAQFRNLHLVNFDTLLQVGNIRRQSNSVDKVVGIEKCHPQEKHSKEQYIPIFIQRRIHIYKNQLKLINYTHSFLCCQLF